MRSTFVDTLTDLAQHDPRIVLLTGDLGYGVVERFAAAAPTRYLNVGVAEQNMIGVATGLAEAGYLPFVYSITTFATLRPYEFIRNGPVGQRLPVRIVGIGTGFDYGANGPTHYALEDVAVLRAQPGLTLITPADDRQAERALRTTYSLPGPVYYRLAKDPTPEVRGLDGRFELGRLEMIGADNGPVAFIAMGNTADLALQAREILEREGIDCRIAVAASISPPPVADLIRLLGSVHVAITLESHYTTGGLGSLVAEVAAESSPRCTVKRHGLAPLPPSRSGSARALMAASGMDPVTVAAIARDALRQESRD